MKFRNVDPQGSIHGNALDGRLVEAGEVVEVFGDVAATLAENPTTWQALDGAPATDVPADVTEDEVF